MSYPEDYALDEGQQRFWRAWSLGRRGPKIVCLCGSTRFWEAFRDVGLRETLAGNIILSIGIHAPGAETFAGHHGGEYKAVKEQLDQLHLWKVSLADEVLILNVGGYVGESTARELDHARALGKTVRWLEPERAR
jgi:hypothetical protein